MTGYSLTCTARAKLAAAVNARWPVLEAMATACGTVRPPLIADRQRSPCCEARTWAVSAPEAELAATSTRAAVRASQLPLVLMFMTAGFSSHSAAQRLAVLGSPLLLLLLLLLLPLHRIVSIARPTARSAALNSNLPHAGCSNTVDQCMNDLNQLGLSVSSGRTCPMLITVELTVWQHEQSQRWSVAVRGPLIG